jgi:ribosomal protein L4
MNMVKSCRNIPGVKVLPHSAMNVYDLVDADVVCFTPDALEGIKEVYGS